MKKVFLLVFIGLSANALAQTGISTDAIDRRSRSLEAATVQELAQKLTAPYNLDFEKVRAIYSWIAQHVAYSYRGVRTRNPNGVSGNEHPVSDDSSSALQPLDEIVAENVFKKRTAICEGYSRLFKYLCEKNNISCEMVHGYARNEANRVGDRFHTNHSWNVVKVDSAWHLVDATWGSGYFTYTSNDFIPFYDDRYFFASPQDFARDHFPDELRWTLLTTPPVMREFQRSPFRPSSFVKYNITSWSPLRGIIEAAVGDTVRLQFSMADAVKKIGGGWFADTTDDRLKIAALCRPAAVRAGTVYYSYIVSDPTLQWLQLIYNDDLIFRYKLDVKPK
jgi:hypothetical protein